MSITTIEPSARNAPAVLLHEGVWIEPGEVPAPRATGRRFPEKITAKTPPRKRRCTIGRDPDGGAPPAATPDAPVAPVAAGQVAARWKVEDADGEQFPVPEEVRPIIEKIFPPAGSMLDLEKSVASIVHAVAPAVLEVMAGARPVRQLVNVLNPECMGKLERHLQIGRDRQPDPGVCCYSNPRVLRIRISQILPFVFEAAVVLLDMQKVRATALRIERWHGRWQVTALEIG